MRGPGETQIKILRAMERAGGTIRTREVEMFTDAKMLDTLKRNGMIEPAGQRGVWAMTDAGREVVAQQ